MQTREQNIPFLDLTFQHKAIQKEINKSAVKVLESGKFILGAETSALENEFAAAIGAKHCIACSSGASAIQIALGACGIGPGDEVITSPFTFIATTSSITLTGAKFILADIDPRTGCLDPWAVSKKITKNTKAVLPVHIYGYPAKMREFMDIAAKHDLKVIEDCAQSHLSKYDGKVTGAIGHAGAFSFYPSKNLGACGDAGAVTTNDDSIAVKCRQLRHNGRSSSGYEHVAEGSTLRMNEIPDLGGQIGENFPRLFGFRVNRLRAQNVVRV